jgi:signal transduction histidine kinase
MGLWTVKHIVSKHGGDIRVESKPGVGTRFTVWWPRESNSEGEPAESSSLGDALGEPA